MICKCFVCAKLFATKGAGVCEYVGEVFGLDMVPHVGPPGHAE